MLSRRVNESANRCKQQFQNDRSGSSSLSTQAIEIDLPSSKPVFRDGTFTGLWNLSDVSTSVPFDYIFSPWFYGLLRQPPAIYFRRRLLSLTFTRPSTTSHHGNRTSYFFPPVIISSSANSRLRVARLPRLATLPNGGPTHDTRRGTRYCLHCCRCCTPSAHHTHLASPSLFRAVPSPLAWHSRLTPDLPPSCSGNPLH